MKNLLIGSRALNIFHPEFKIKDETDYDIISDEPIEGSEHHLPDLVGNYKLEEYVSDRTIELAGQTIHVVNPIGLCIVKRSHLWRDLGFDKHIAHYHKHLAKYRNHFNAHDEELLKERKKLTIQKFERGHPKLNQKVEDFFDDAVKKVYNHDWLHSLVAYYDKPLYSRMQPDPSMAWCDRNMWNEFPYEDKVKCVAEECFVISIERFLVPQWDIPPKLAFIKALRKACTTLCSGWFRDFAIDNYPQILHSFDQEKINRVKEKIDDFDNS